MKNHLSSASLLATTLLVLLVGCASPSKELESSAPSVGATAATRGTPGTAAATLAGATPSTTAQSGVSTVNLVPGASGTGAAGAAGAGAGAAGSALMTAPTQRVVYFDFDSFVVKDEFAGLLESHAKALARQSGKQMVIEGHTDERGGREYNLALGQKRAEAVLKSLSLLGVPASQLEAVSFGEERPVATGAEESAWARNRRAVLKDR
jgi:peptidoglycan-associated lipoprotein